MRALVCWGAIFVLAGCIATEPPPAPAAPKAEAAAPASPKAETPPAEHTAAERWAEGKVLSEPAPVQAKAAPAKETLDPLASSELEESSIPDTEITPPKQLRAKSPRALNAAIGVVKSAGSVDEAAKKLTKRLGKPTWTEWPKGSTAKRRVWVASAKDQCHRLVLEADGSVEVESAKKDDWRMLTASAKQNACTGEIKRGLAK